jgi:hypothetical protein
LGLTHDIAPGLLRAQPDTLAERGAQGQSADVSLAAPVMRGTVQATAVRMLIMAKSALRGPFDALFAKINVTTPRL